MADEVDHTAGHVRSLIEGWRLFNDCVQKADHETARAAFDDMQISVIDAEMFLNRPPEK